jgi:Fe-S-cluster-containing hydrogenase component 2
MYLRNKERAVDFFMATPAAWISESPIFIRGCIQSKTKHVCDMKKCLYPKCTLYIDNCTMNSIDFSQNPLVVYNNCEGCDVCWCVCPTGAIDITNIAETHARLGVGGRDNEDRFFVNLVKLRLKADSEG